MLPFLEATLPSGLNDCASLNYFLGLCKRLRESLEVQCGAWPPLLAGRNLPSQLEAALQATRLRLPGQFPWEMGGGLSFLPLALLWFSHSEPLQG